MKNENEKEKGNPAIANTHFLSKSKFSMNG